MPNIPYFLALGDDEIVVAGDFCTLFNGVMSDEIYNEPLAKNRSHARHGNIYCNQFGYGGHGKSCNEMKEITGAKVIFRRFESLDHCVEWLEGEDRMEKMVSPVYAGPRKIVVDEVPLTLP